MGYLDGFLITLRQHRIFGGQRVTTSYSGGRVAKKGKRVEGRDEKIAKPERLHGRHVLNRYDDGMEKCIGCELCAGVCPAKCIYVRGADNDAENPTSPGERFGFVYEINYLRCIHCDLCVEACPTEAITETKLFEFSFTNRDDAIYTKAELLVADVTGDLADQARLAAENCPERAIKAYRIARLPHAAQQEHPQEPARQPHRCRPRPDPCRGLRKQRLKRLLIR